MIPRTLYLPLLLLLNGALACAQTGLISTYAGNGSAGSSGDGGTATSAQLNNPIGLAVDASGNLFIADSTNSRIRKVSGGVITTVAGGGTGGDGGLATAAQLRFPCYVALDSAGNLYISETCTSASSGTGGGGGGGAEVNRIRRVDAVSGIITTIAGGVAGGFGGDNGPAAGALLNTPGGLSIDGSGNIYVADSGNNRVRRIDAASGVITTVAGNGTAAFAGDSGPAVAASLSGPSAVALDSAGNLFIADSGNNRIRRVDAVSGIITSVAGSGSPAYNGDGIAATSANISSPTALQVNGAGNLILADLPNGRVRLVDMSSGLIWTIAGNGGIPICCQNGDGDPATLAYLNAPAGVALSPTGPLFVAELLGDRVRQVALQNPLVSTAVNETASGASVPAASPLTLTATLSVMSGTPASVTGGVEFVDGANILGNGQVANGSASFTTSSLTMGAHNIAAWYFGDSVFGASISLPVSVTITAPQSSVALVANPNPAVSGQPVTLTATVTPSTATGSVSFFNGSTPLGTMGINNGAAVLSGVTFTNGSYSLTAQYPGNINLPASTSPAVALTVKSAPSVVLTSNANPSTPGQAVTFTANLNQAMATGTVQFLDNGIAIGSASVVNSAASFSISTLTAGIHSITASYGGDAIYASATSAPLTQTVLVATSAVVTSSQNPSAVGAPVTFTATVTPAVATGTVQFLDGRALLGTATLAGGSAMFSTSTLTQAAHFITAAYSGDANNAGSTSPQLVQTVKTASSVVLTSNTNPSAVGQSVTFTAVVSPNTAMGTVQFLDNGVAIGSTFVGNSGAIFSISTLSLGLHSITASYGGDANDASSTSAALTQTVLVATSVVVASSQNPSAVGAPVTFTASVTPATATGTVQFLDGKAILGTANLAGGSAMLTTSTLTQAAHSVTAVYSGDANNAGSTSPQLVQTVKLTAGLTLASSANPSTVGQAVTFTANVNAAATGTVQFLDGATVLATVPASSGAAAYSTSTLTQGTHSITASYSGDTNYLSAQSSVLTETVNLTSTTALASSQNPVIVGGTVSFTATVTPATATGSVQFLDGTTVLGTGVLSSGSASFTTSALTQGTHPITAVYGGDASDAGSTSAVLSQSVKALIGLNTGVNPNPPVAGQPVTFSVTMNTAATGTVTFSEGSTVLATVPVVSGAASYTTSSLSAGAHLLSVGYSGDATYSSAGTVISVSVLAATSIGLSSNPNPSNVGQNVTFTVSVTPPAATGIVQVFQDNVAVLGTATLTAGTAAISTSGLAAGTHTFYAIYVGDSNYGGARSSTLTQNVNLAATSTTLGSSSNPALLGSAVMFTAVVNPATATGTVRFLDGSTLLGTVTLAGGSASLTTSALAQGAHSIVAVYSGDASDTGSTSAVLSESVKSLAGFNASVSPNPPVAFQPVTLRATVNSAATGTVTFLDGSTVLATVAVASGAASYTTSLAAGVHALTFSYSGDANYLSAGTTFSVTVLAVSSIGLTSSANPSGAGQSVTFMAMVSPSTATGTVQFLDHGTPIGTATLASGVAAFSTASLATGTHSITATYAGDANDTAASSGAIAQTVKTVASVALTSSANPSIVGQQVRFTASVTPFSATGTVQFLDGSSVLATVGVFFGTASFSTSSLAQGSHSIKAVYSGDTKILAAASATLTQIVNLPAPQAPSNLRTTGIGSSYIDLAWNASPTGGVTYNVYSSTNSGFTPSASNRIASGVTATSYAATGLRDSTKYYFRVTAVDSGGESAATNQASGTTQR